MIAMKNGQDGGKMIGDFLPEIFRFHEQFAAEKNFFVCVLKVVSSEN
jgi:hypothetical protein